MKTTNKSGIELFISECMSYGMRNVVCSPGSRNAPIIIAIDAHPDINTIVIHDERSAAFYALGMAQQLNEPVGMVCTSGSAMLNYYPAVAEAFYQCIPLVVMSADRPEEWVNHGDGQTIVQDGVYDNHIRFAGTINETAYTSEEIVQLKNEIESAFEIGNGNWKGPIHFNIPITEPLYETVERNYTGIIRHKTKSRERFSFSETEKEIINECWKESKKIMILCGQMNKDNVLLERLSILAEDSSVAVLVETTSNLNSPGFVHCIDRTLSGIHTNEIIKFQPDLLITLGGAIISKKIKDFLRSAEIKNHWKIGCEFPEMDTFRALTNSFQCQPSEFIDGLLKLKLEQKESSFGNKWKQKDYVVQGKLEDYFDEIPLSDLKVFETILDYIPENSILHMGNSSVVRYCQLFDPIKSIDYYSNRGTSGIDGCTSTACGAALITSDKYNVLITGDVSFFYDSNALWSAYLAENLRIILINNNGGGIFRIIDGPSDTNQLTKYFEARHSYNAELISKAFDVEYIKATSIENIESKMEEFYKISENKRPKLIEIFTPPDLNDKVLKEYFNHVKSS